MSVVSRRGASGMRAVAAVALGASLGGCLVYDVASAPVKLAVGTAKVAGNVAIGTAKVAGGAIKLAAGLARAGAVTFVDAAGNDVRRVPWREGMTLAAASDAAKVRLAQRPVDVVRDGQVIYSAENNGEKYGNAPVASGDVVQVGK